MRTTLCFFHKQVLCISKHAQVAQRCICALIDDAVKLCGRLHFPVHGLNTSLHDNDHQSYQASVRVTQQAFSWPSGTVKKNELVSKEVGEREKAV